MKKVLLLLILPITIFAQFSPSEIIDSSEISTGISAITDGDINRDGFRDIITCNTGQAGKVGYYLNENGESFSAYNTIDEVSYLGDVKTADFNNDEELDIVTIGSVDNNIYIYSGQESFSSPIVIDTSISILINEVVTDDFDGDGMEDLVVIGQHAINFYRNQGDFAFAKEEILTTSSSPRVLECLSLAKADFNGDGIPDVATGETAGLVIYTNSGDGEFTPSYYDTLEIVLNIHPMDIDGDNDPDILLKNSFREIKWYENDGDGNFTFGGDIELLPETHDFSSLDINNDGLEDIYATSLHNVTVFYNDENHSFNEKITLHQDDELYMNALEITDLDNDERKDLIWSGTTKVLALNRNITHVSTTDNYNENINLYPNPASNKLHIKADQKNINSVVFYNLQGKIIKEFRNSFSLINISDFPGGILFVRIKTDSGIYSRKLLIQP